MDQINSLVSGPYGPYAAAAIAGAISLIFFCKKLFTKPEVVRKPGVVYYHQLPRPTFGRHSASPYCIKLEAWLKLVGIPYEDDSSGSSKGPKGKWPWIELDGEKIGDSSIIIDVLKAKFGKDPDAGLSATDRALATALQRLVEDHLGFYLMHERWVVAKNWPTVKKAFFSSFPFFVPWLITIFARPQVRKASYYHGIGRHSQEQMDAFAIQDVDALSALLGDKQFFLGSRMTTVDCTIFGMLEHCAIFPLPSPATERFKSLPNLVAFRNRVEEAIYG